MAADLNLILNGTPVPVYLGENTANASASASRAEAAADEAQEHADDAAAIAEEFRTVADAVGYMVPDKLWVFSDAEGQVIGSVDLDAGWDILLKQLAAADGTSVSSYEMVGDAPPFVFVDADDKVLFEAPPLGTDTSAEVIEARGARDVLDDRLSLSLDDYGLPKRHVWNEWRLWQTRDRLTRRLMGEATQFIWAAIGDSWTYREQRYIEPLADKLAAEFGDAGGGWIGFGLDSGDNPNGNARNDYSVVDSGSWVATYTGSPSPDLCHSTSSTPGDKFTITFPASPILSGVDLFWVGTADGVMQYRWDGGSWTSINVQGGVGDLESAALSGVPGTGSAVLEIEVVSGTCSPAGLNAKAAASGVCVHKLGASGSRASHWVAVDAEQWQEGLAALAPHLVTIMLGTNDRDGGLDPDEVATNIGTLIDRIQAACPVADVAIIMPCEAPKSATYDMNAYVAAVAPVAIQKGAVWLDLQKVFGDDPAVYASDGARPLFESDDIHPTDAQRVIAGAIYRLLTQY